MIYLILGLVLFLGTHSIRMFAGEWRSRTIAGGGEGKWKGVYSLVSIAGFALIVWGYGQARLEPGVLYNPPLFMRHIAGLLMLLSIVLVAAAYVPGNHFKAALGHPMAAGVKTWALAHLLANGGVADVVLFGAFLVWSVANFAISRRRDRTAGVSYPPGRLSGTLIAAGIGGLVWAAFAFGLHKVLIGVAPFG
jgi:uncharacterized membrane protein